MPDSIRELMAVGRELGQTWSTDKVLRAIRNALDGIQENGAALDELTKPKKRGRPRKRIR